MKSVMDNEKRAPSDWIPEPDGSTDALSVPNLDGGVRQRLTARFGAEIGSWLDELPDVLGTLAERWHIGWGSLIPRGICRSSSDAGCMMDAPPC
jgi:hypothetical protein